MGIKSLLTLDACEMLSLQKPLDGVTVLRCCRFRADN